MKGFDREWDAYHGLDYSQYSSMPADGPLSASQVTDLLDHVIYEQVLACVDLDALHDLEQSLTMLAGDVDGVAPDHAADLAKAMLDRALLRLPDDMRRYLRAASRPL
jgi:hypothetical protein